MSLGASNTVGRFQNMQSLSVSQPYRARHEAKQIKQQDVDDVLK